MSILLDFIEKMRVCMNNQENYKDALRQLKAHANWYLILGIGLVIVGSLAVVFSLLSTLLSVIYLGAFLVMLGAFEAVRSFKAVGWSSFLHILLAILYVISGLFIVINPGSSALSLTLLLGIFFVISGIMKIITSFVSVVPQQRTWLLLNGILTLFIGIFIWYEWPYSGLWVIGTFVGIDTIFTGLTWIMLSLAAKNKEEYRS
jgi:uncharacterized membrane protein HdeD (DUF308 family)